MFAVLIGDQNLRIDIRDLFFLLPLYIFRIACYACGGML